jgi:hypothetical protein
MKHYWFDEGKVYIDGTTSIHLLPVRVRPFIILLFWFNIFGGFIYMIGPIFASILFLCTIFFSFSTVFLFKIKSVLIIPSNLLFFYEIYLLRLGKTDKVFFSPGNCGR